MSYLILCMLKMRVFRYQQLATSVLLFSIFTQTYFLPFIYLRQIYTWSAYFSVKNISIPREKETALLLQKTAQQLGTSKIDIEALTRTFQFYDNERTEMLSANEVLVIGLFIILLPLFFLSVFYNISWRFLSMNLDFRLQYFFFRRKG